MVGKFGGKVVWMAALCIRVALLDGWLHAHGVVTLDCNVDCPRFSRYWISQARFLHKLVATPLPVGRRTVKFPLEPNTQGTFFHCDSLAPNLLSNTSSGSKAYNRPQLPIMLDEKDSTFVLCQTFLAVYFLTQVQSVPRTGRSQTHDLSPSRTWKLMW